MSSSFKQQQPAVSYVVAQVLSAAILVNILHAFYNFGNIKNALGFYGVYHREPMNQLIHFFGVPLIIWSMVIILAMLPLPLVPANNKHSTWAPVYCATYILGYLQMDLFGGLLYAPIILAFYFTSVHWVAQDQKRAQSLLKKESVPWYGTVTLLKWALAAHVFAWYVQIHPGHKVIEGAQPAVLTSLGGALSSAPLFAFYEGLWYIGLQSELRQETLARVAELTAEICAQDETAMRICASL